MERYSITKAAATTSQRVHKGMRTFSMPLI